METHLINDKKITNCGLIALKFISELKNISVRTLVFMAEDNGVKLYPYNVPLGNILSVKLPAIFHEKDHFVYVETIDDLQNISPTGVVLSTNKLDYELLNQDELNKINGGSWVAAGAAAVTIGVGAYKSYQGKKQKEEGERAKRRLVKPDYVIPDEIKRNLKESELRALEGLPTEQKMEYIKNLERSQQTALQSQAERKGGLLGIQQSAQQATDAFTNLTSIDAQARAENQQLVQMNRNALAQAKDKEFAFDEGRYQQDLQSAQAMIGAGQQNTMGGYDMMAAGAIQGGTALAGSGGNRMSNQQGGTGNRRRGQGQTLTLEEQQKLGWI